jgi:nitrite reductase/ring-hydroxylating ferredoxin subunit
MKKFYPVGSIHDLKPGKGYKIRIKRKTIALFIHKNIVYAIQNNCPHQNADLADGYIKDGKVYCTLHHWAFDLSTGSYSFNPNVSIQTFEIKIEDDIIYVGIDKS